MYSHIYFIYLIGIFLQARPLSARTLHLIPAAVVQDEDEIVKSKSGDMTSGIDDL